MNKTKEITQEVLRETKQVETPTWNGWTEGVEYESNTKSSTKQETLQ